MSGNIGVRKKLTWRVLNLSAGEVTMADHVQTAGKRTKGGVEVRLLNVEADAEAVGTDRMRSDYQKDAHRPEAVQRRKPESWALGGAPGARLSRCVLRGQRLSLAFVDGDMRLKLQPCASGFSPIIGRPVTRTSSLRPPFDFPNDT